MGVRYANRVDSNQGRIVAVLRKEGASVAITSSLGHGFTDIVVGYCGLNALAEIKDGSLSPCRQKLTKDEQEFHESWRGQICILRNEQEAIQLLHSMRNADAGKFTLSPPLPV